MLNVGIINITGAAGAEIARLVYSHPELKLVSATGRSKAGERTIRVFPHLEKTDIKTAKNYLIMLNLFLHFLMQLVLRNYLSM